MAKLQYKPIEYAQAEGLYIKYLRLQQGWTQEMLANECGCQKSLISAIEHGKSILKETEIKICAALGVEPWVLCRVRKNWQKLIARTEKMETELRAKIRQERKAKGLKG